MAQQTAVEWLIEQINNKPLASGWSESQITISISKDIIEQAKQMEREQMGYTKEDVLKAGEIGEINHYDYEHIVSLLDEAREINKQNK